MSPWSIDWPQASDVRTTHERAEHMKRLLITLLLTGCAGSAPMPVSEAPPAAAGLGNIVLFDPSVPTRWVQDHQNEFGFGGVKSIEHVSTRHVEVVESGVVGYVDSRHYTVHTRDRGVLQIMTEERNYGGERVASVFTGSALTNDLVFICQGGTC